MKLLTEKQVLERIQVGRTTLRRWLKKDTFPQPLAMGPGRIGWLEEEVEGWIQSRPRGVGKVALYA